MDLVSNQINEEFLNELPELDSDDLSSEEDSLESDEESLGSDEKDTSVSIPASLLSSSRSRSRSRSRSGLGQGPCQCSSLKQTQN